MPHPVRYAWTVTAALATLGAGGAAEAQPAPPPTVPATPAPEPQAPPPPAETSPPLTLELGGHLGVAVRTGDTAHFRLVERAGLTFGASAYVTPTPAFSLGLLLEHTDLGRERSGVGELGTVEVVRDLNTAWASIRLNLVSGAMGGLGLAFGPGLAWQSAEASGVALSSLGGETFACSASDTASLALRAGLAGSLSLGGGLALIGGATAEAAQLSSGVMDGCITGAGTATLFGARFGFAYAFDVGPYVR